MDTNLIFEEIKRFREITSYKTGKTISEQVPIIGYGDNTNTNVGAFLVDCSKVAGINQISTKVTPQEQYSFANASGLNPKTPENQIFFCDRLQMDKKLKDIQAQSAAYTQPSNVTGVGTTKATSTPITQTQPKIPTELKDIDGVKAFQDWLDTNKSGWATGYTGGVLKGGKGHGRFGPRTTRAWGLYKDIYLNPPSKIPPLSSEELKILDGIKPSVKLNSVAATPTVKTPVIPATQTPIQTQTPDQYYQQLVQMNLIDPVGGRRIVYKGTPPSEDVKKTINDYLSTQGYTLKNEKSKSDGREKIVWTK